MAYMITDDCAACSACIDECPNEAISEGDGKCVIDAEKCTECYGFAEKSKCDEVCPSTACVPDPDHKETQEQLAAKYAKLHPNRPPSKN